MTKSLKIQGKSVKYAVFLIGLVLASAIFTTPVYGAVATKRAVITKTITPITSIMEVKPTLPTITSVQAQFDAMKRELSRMKVIQAPTKLYNNRAVSINDLSLSRINLANSLVTIKSVYQITNAKFGNILDAFYGDNGTPAGDVLQNLIPYITSSTPANFLWVFPISPAIGNAPYIILNPSDINLSSPKVSAIFAICNYGTQTAKLNSGILSLVGNDAGSTDFNIYLQGNKLWNQSIKTSYQWQGDMKFPSNFNLAANKCTYIAVTYTKAENTNNKDLTWRQFRFQGLSSNLPAYYIREQGPYSNIKYLEKLSDTSDNYDILRGTKNIFKAEKKLYLTNGPQLFDHLMDPSAENMMLTRYSLANYDNSNANVNNITINVSSTYNVPIKSKITISGPLIDEYTSGAVVQEINLDLMPGNNIVQVNKNLDYGQDLSIAVFAKEFPDSTSQSNKITITLTNINSSGQIFEALCGYILSNSCMQSATPFDGYQESTIVTQTYVADSIVRLYITPGNSAGGWAEEVGNTNEASSNLLHITINKDTSINKIKIKNLSIAVQGNFSDSMTVGLTRENVNGTINVEETLSITNGQIINIPEFVLDKEYSYNGNFEIDIDLISKPIDANNSFKYVKFLIMNMEAEYMNNGTIVHTGDIAPIYKCPVQYNNCTTNFTYPIISEKRFFGPKRIFINKADTGYGSYEFIDLSETQPDDEIRVNRSYIEPQGSNMYLHTVTFAHMARETSPFSDIILDTGTNSVKLYQKDATWTENEVVFKFTSPLLISHGDNRYLELSVLAPTAPITNVWFNLTGLDIKEKNENPVKIYTNLNPQTELSADSPISGTTFDFE